VPDACPCALPEEEPLCAFCPDPIDSPEDDPDEPPEDDALPAEDALDEPPEEDSPDEDPLDRVAPFGLAAFEHAVPSAMTKSGANRIDN
jgi:hypothetical protein